MTRTLSLRRRKPEAGIYGFELLGRAELDLRVVHTSVLTRAIRTANIALDSAGRSWLPVRRSWRLNERHYGDLTGKDKKPNGRGVAGLEEQAKELATRSF